MGLPKKIEVCPIIDSIVEIRFESKIYPNAVFGVIYNALKKDFANVEKLPILQIIEQVKGESHNFKYKPHYKIFDETYTIQIGPNVITISSPIPYVGWEEFSKKIYYCFGKIFELDVVDYVVRLGIRVINFFNIDIFEKVNLRLSFEELAPPLINTTLRTQVELDNFTNTMQIANNVSQKTGEEIIIGSIIDIDTFKEYDENFDFPSYFREEIQVGHDIEKKIFFTLLKKDFLDSLKPVY